MFKKNNRYITRGINDSVDIRLQLLIWSVIDNLNEKVNVEVDYLQVFEIRKEGNSIIIEHSQEEPEYKAVYSLELQDVELDNKIKIYVIDSWEYSTMLLEDEY